VDTTAAGDIFHGAFLFSLHRGESFRDGLLFGAAAAALSTETPGGRSSIPSVEQVRTFIERYKNRETFPVPRRLS
jgi:sulfofructose kinase